MGMLFCVVGRIEIATPELALSGGEILRLRLRMTGSEGARNDNGEDRNGTPSVIARHKVPKQSHAIMVR